MDFTIYWIYTTKCPTRLCKWLHFGRNICQQLEKRNNQEDSHHKIKENQLAVIGIKFSSTPKYEDNWFTQCVDDTLIFCFLIKFGILFKTFDLMTFKSLLCFADLYEVLTRANWSLIWLFEEIQMIFVYSNIQIWVVILGNVVICTKIKTKEQI